MQPVPLCDSLELERVSKPGITLTCSNPALPTDSSNLVFRAATGFLEQAGIHEGVKIHLEKRIPLAAGLGGGSGNAAATLVALNELFDSALSGQQIQRLAAGLGSDVPLFLQSLPALATGRPRTAADWAGLPLLQQSTRPYAWRQFFDGLGLAVPQAMAGPRLELFSMLTEAAVHGMGVALAPPFFVQEELAQGRLVDIAPQPVGGQRAYSLIWPEEKAELPALQAFAAWLQAEAAG